MTTIVSQSDPEVCVRLTDEVREHLGTHFGKGLPGSKFAFDTPDTLLQIIVNTFPERIKEAGADEDGRKRISFTFPFDIGTCNVVGVDSLTEEERDTLHRVQRGTKVVRVVESSRVFPTDDCQLVLSKDNDVITLYPGEAAPPLPDTPDVPDAYWDGHVFIETKSRG